MSFVSILDSYKSQVSITASRFACMSHATPTATITAVLTELENVKTAIKSGIDSLFDDPNVTQGSRMNFMTINGLGNSFKNVQEWSVPEDSFTDRLEYSQCPFLFYSIGALGTNGLFLNEFQSYISNVSVIMMNYQTLYDSFSYVTSKIDEFWIAYGTTFNTDMMTNINQFSTVKTDFNSIPGKVVSFKDIGTSGSIRIAIGQIFIQARNQTDSSGSLLSTIFSNYGSSGFSIYNTEIGTIYGIHESSLAEAMNSRLYSEEDLPVIQKSNILKSYNFFTDSETLLAQLQTLVDRYK